MKRYLLVEVDIPEEDQDEVNAATWMAATIDVARVNSSPSYHGAWKRGDPIPPHPYRPKVMGEVDPIVAQAIVMKIVTDEARPVTELRKSVPPHVAAATTNALEKLPADRFATAKEFAEALTNPVFTLPMMGPGVAPTSAVANWKQHAFIPLASVTVAAIAVARPHFDLEVGRCAIENSVAKV